MIMKQTVSDKKTHASIFTTKSNVLKLLKSKINFSKIEKIFDFTQSQWEKNQNQILDQVIKNFPNTKIIIRSSAIGEDSEENSNAGSYESILNVNSSSKQEISSAIQNVINSYKNKDNFNPKNQILVQTQSKNILYSGVIFSRSPDLGSPFYVVNYDVGDSTVGVTHGSINETIKFHRQINKNSLESKWKNLLFAIDEIEIITNSTTLDIEFGITKSNKIIIFQVRPITSFSDDNFIKSDRLLKKSIKNNQTKFSKLKSSKNLHPAKNIFSDMTDWNPAEIIGNNPRPLDYSLYDYLIMKSSWYRARVELGYQKFSPHCLMVKFGNKPYVDTRISFNSLIPENFNYNLKKKLMKYYLEKLNSNPHLHDKVEFDVLFTCYDLSLKNRLKELKKFGFNQKEIEEIFESLLLFTKKIITNFPETSKSCNDSINIMTKNRINYMKQIKKSSNYHHKLQIAEKLLNDCINFGIIPFSKMARIAFISTAFLKSLVTQNYVSQKEFDKFMNSLVTPLSKFQYDLILLTTNKITKAEFLKIYGHLRPGTYDITINRYDKDNPFLNIIKSSNFTKSKIFKFKIKNLDKILESSDIQIEQDEFYNFIINSIVMREELKFEFTHNLSDALELIAESSSELGLFRDDISYLEIGTILSSYKKFTKNELKSFLKKQIPKNKFKFQINTKITLPSIISSERDFEIIQYHTAKPNYITEKTISERIINLDISKSTELENKIILLEHADPGYDWIFAKNPLGLITKYGGVASHMSIRCSEVGLPASIGCGEIIYEKLLNASKVMLDCKNHQIVILEQKTNDEYSEQKKILKSLGYIK
jgi:glutamine kinase